MLKKFFKIYNRLTDSADAEYQEMCETNSCHIQRAKKIMFFLESQDISLNRLNLDDPDTGDAYYLSDIEATVYDPISEDDVDKRYPRKIEYEKNYNRSDIYIIAKALQMTETLTTVKTNGAKRWK